ncbi:competence protein ComK [Oceanobacillus sp. J11TS1]|uniref:competence protein ComK n=1 Tax=Oceanobacillus sp. J11TS1 TaxID=2807191 RepID=UPI002467C9F1|nr:competence protein ComK [Oceanobacillus sp. J11TS1]
MAISYIINENTMAILPSHSKKHASKVYELKEDLIHSFKEKPFTIVEQNCMRHFSSYTGRRESVLYHTDFAKKTPIPISSNRGIIAFPTMGITHKDCAWIFYRHVFDVKERGSGCVVIFKNGTELFQSLSRERFLKQIVRCKALDHLIKNNKESRSPVPDNLPDVSDISDAPDEFLIARILKTLTDPVD